MTENASGGGPILDVRQRWRAGYVALGTAALMTIAAFWRPLASEAHPRLRVVHMLVLGLGLAARPIQWA